MADKFVIPGTSKPTTSWLSVWFKRQWNTWRERRDLDTEVRDLIYSQNFVDVTGPNGEESSINHEIVRTGLARTLLREYVGIISGESPRFECLPDGLGPDKQRRASEVEEWDAAWYQDSGGNDVQSLVDADAIAYGRGVSYVIWARQFWHGFPEPAEGENDGTYLARVASWAKNAPNPILRMHCPAPQTMFDDDEWTRIYGHPNVVYWYHRPISEIAAAYPNSAAAKAYSGEAEDDPLVLFITFANRKYITYAYSETLAVADPDAQRAEPVAVLHIEPGEWEILQTFEHGAGRNPFEVVIGDSASDPALVHKYAGLFDNSLVVLRQIDEAISQAATAIRRYGRSQLVLMHEWGPAGQLPGGVDPDTMAPREIDWEPGRVLSLAPGERLAFVQPDLNSYKAGMEFHDLLTRYVARDTIDPAAWAGAASTNSGFQLVTLIQTAERKLRNFVNRKCRSLENTLRAVHGIVEYIDRPIAIWRATDEESDGGTIVAVGGWVTLKPVVAKTARVRVKLAPRLDSADAASAQIGIQLAQASTNGWLDIDKDWILSRWLGLENPERHRRAALLQRFLNNPEIQAWLTQKALADAELTLKAEDVRLAAGIANLSPEELMLAPEALRQELAARGLIPGANNLLAAQQGVPPGGLPGGAPGMAGILQAVAPPGTPTPGAGTTMSGGPGGQAAAVQSLGGQSPQQSPFGGLDLARAAGQYGGPVSPLQGM
jgi:hypothetical protein